MCKRVCICSDQQPVFTASSSSLSVVLPCRSSLHFLFPASIRLFACYSRCLVPVFVCFGWFVFFGLALGLDLACLLALFLGWLLFCWPCSWARSCRLALFFGWLLFCWSCSWAKIVFWFCSRVGCCSVGPVLGANSCPFVRSFGCFSFLFPDLVCFALELVLVLLSRFFLLLFFASLFWFLLLVPVPDLVCLASSLAASLVLHNKGYTLLTFLLLSCSGQLF